MIPLSQYLKVNEKYCVAYRGHSQQYVDQLIWARPYIEKELPRIQIYIACKDHLMPINEKRMVPESKLKIMRNKFGYIRELKYDLVTNPIEAFLMESDLLETLKLFHQQLEKK